MSVQMVPVSQVESLLGQALERAASQMQPKYEALSQRTEALAQAVEVYQQRLQETEAELGLVQQENVELRRQNLQLRGQMGALAGRVEVLRQQPQQKSEKELFLETLGSYVKGFLGLALLILKK